MSKVTIKLNRKGVRQLLQSPEMENALTGIAFAAQNRLGEGYKASYYKASTRVVAKVSAESPAARKENADTKPPPRTFQVCCKAGRRRPTRACWAPPARWSLP